MKQIPDKKGFKGRGFKNIALLILLIVIMFLIFRNPLFLSPEVRELTMDEFVESVTEGRISSGAPMLIKGEDKSIVGELANGTSFKVSFLSEYDVTKLLLDNGIPFKIDNQKQNIWLQILIGAIPFIIMFGLIFFMMNQLQGGGSKILQFGKSKAKLANKDKQRVTFKDVAGVDEAIEELQEIGEFLEKPGTSTF